MTRNLDERLSNTEHTILTASVSVTAWQCLLLLLLIFIVLWHNAAWVKCSLMHVGRIYGFCATDTSAGISSYFRQAQIQRSRACMRSWEFDCNLNSLVDPKTVAHV